MLREMVIRNTRTLNKLTSPKLVNSISKYMYIRKLIDEFEISLILDVGANIGQFGTSMRELGYTGTLVSFEPVAAQFAKLKAAASGDPNWITLNCAAGVADETKSINVMSSSVFSSFNAPSKLQTSNSLRQMRSSRPSRSRYGGLTVSSTSSGCVESLRIAF